MNCAALPYPKINLFLNFLHDIFLLIRIVIQKEIRRKLMSGNATKLDFRVLDKILEKYEFKKSYLIAMLQKVQEEYKYLPEEAMTYIGEKVDGLSPATVYGVATFYAQFSLEPKGKYEIRVCDGTACHVRGSMPVLNAIRNKLNLKDGKVTSDNGLFSLEIVSCLGACGLAPVCMVNDKVYPQMTSDAISIILDTLMKEEGVI
jgi:NADH-quinone oxidoreductase subunit E